MQDFKSYGGRQTLGPFRSDWTAVVGPNGAGKSNVMDAVCFVLGLPSRSIRADKLRDLVFRVEGRAADEQARSASVKLVYVMGEGEVPGLDAGYELEFERCVTAAGASVFRVGGTEVSAEDYARSLLEIRVDTRSRNFLVFQGDVSSLAEKDPRSMLQHFEVFSGAAELKARFEALVGEVEEARRDFNTRQGARRQLQADRTACKRQKEEADRFNEVQATLAARRVQQRLMHLFYLDAEIVQQEAAHGLSCRGLEDAERREDEVGRQWAALSKTAAAAQQRRAKLAAQVQAKAKEVRERDERAQRATVECANLKRAMQDGAGAQKPAADAVARAEAEVESLEAEIAEVDRKLGLLGDGAAAGAGAGAGAKKGATPSKAMADKDRGDYNALKAKERQQSADQREKLERLQRERDGDEAERDKHVGNLDAARQRIATLEAQSEVQASRKAELEAARKEAEASLQARQAELEKYRKDLADAVSRQEGIGRDLEKVQGELAAFSALKHKSDHEKRVEAAVEDMKRLFSGVRGRVADLVEPVAKKYGLAVSIALGKHADAVVVNTEAAAIECVRWLRENKIRPMTFLPLDTIRPKAVGDEVAAAVNGPRKVYRLARDVLSFDPEMERAVNYVCGDTVVCEKLEEATELRFKRGVVCKIVTTDGCIVSKNSNMSGGMGDRDDVGRASRWDEKAMKAAEAQRNTLLSEEELLRRRLAKHRGPSDQQSLYSLIESADYEAKTLASRLTQVKKGVEQQGTMLGAAEAELKALRAEVSKSQAALSATEARLGSRRAELSELQAALDKVTDEIFRDFTARLGISSIREYESQVVERLAAEQRQRQALSETGSKLRSKVDFERKKLADCKRAQERILKEASEAGKRLLALEKDAKEAQETVAEARSAVEGLREQLDKASSEESSAAQKREELTSMRAAALHEKAARAKEVSGYELALEKLRGDRHKRLAEAQMDNIALPLKGAPGAGEGAGSRAGASGKAKREPAAGGGRKRSKGRRDAEEDEEEDDEDGDAAMDGGSGAGAGSHVAGAVFSGSSATGSSNSGGTSENAQDQRRSDRVDYDKLEGRFQNLSTPEQRARLDLVVAEEIHGLSVELSKINPNAKAAERFAEAESKLAAGEHDFFVAKERRDRCEKEFAGVKGEREGRLRRAFDHVRKNIDGVYKELTKSAGHPKGGQASLDLLGDEALFEPDQGGIRYTAIPPAKSFREMAQLSGGEKTVAALALLFAMHSYTPSPFIIMDEIDAALDNVNVFKVASFLLQRSKAAPPLQFIVISLKDQLFSSAAGIIGIYKDSSIGGSGSISLDMSGYTPVQNEGVDAGAAPRARAKRGEREDVDGEEEGGEGEEEDEESEAEEPPPPPKGRSGARKSR